MSALQSKVKNVSKTEAKDGRRTRKRGKRAFSAELEACQSLLVELGSAKHEEYAYLFYRPVDVVELPDYLNVIKSPMDLKTMKGKLEAHEYSTAKDFKNDLHLMVNNCRKYNKEQEIIEMVGRFEDVVLERMQIIESRFPQEQDVKTTQGALNDKGVEPGSETADKLQSEAKQKEPVPSVGVVEGTEANSHDKEAASKESKKRPQSPGPSKEMDKDKDGPVKKKAKTDDSQKATKAAKKGSDSPPPTDKESNKRTDSAGPSKEDKDKDGRVKNRSKIDKAENPIKTASKKRSGSSPPTAQSPDKRPRLDEDPDDMARELNLRTPVMAVGETGTNWFQRVDNPQDCEDLNIDIKQLYDVDYLKEMITEDDESGSIEESVMEACIRMKPSIQELCSGKLLAWLEWLAGATGIDPLMSLSHLIGAEALFMNGSVVEVHKGNGHVSPVNIWNYIVALKGSKKSASLEIILKAVRQVERDLLKAQDDEEKDEQGMFTPVKNVSANSFADSSPKKITPKTRLLQGGTVEGLISTMHKAEKPQVLMAFDELSNFFDRTLNKEGKLTPFGINLLAMFGSIDTRDVTSGRGIRIIESPYVSIIGGIQPKILLNIMAKDPDDPASFIDRANILVTESPTLTLREQSQFMEENPEVLFPLEDLFATTNKMHSEENPRWVFEKRAMELVYQIDEAMADFEEANKYNGEIRGRQAKGRDQMYRYAPVFAMLRMYGNSLRPDGTSDIQDERKIILISDVVKAARLVWYGVYCHIQYKEGARQMASGSRPGKKQKTVTETKKPAVNSLLSDLHDWKKPLGDYLKQTAGKIKLLYLLSSTNEDGWVSGYDISKKREMYPRNPGKLKNQSCCLLFLRFLQYNGIGEIKENTEDENVVDPTDKFLRKLRFRLFRKSVDVSNQSKQLFQVLIPEMGLNPFEEEEKEEESEKKKKKKKKNKRKDEEVNNLEVEENGEKKKKKKKKNKHKKDETNDQ